MLVPCSLFQLFVLHFTFYALPQPIFCRTASNTTNSCFYNHTSPGCFEYIARNRGLNANASQYYFLEFQHLIHKGDIWIDMHNCPYYAIDITVACWATNSRLLPSLGECDCAACGSAPSAKLSARVVELFCSDPSIPVTTIQTVPPCSTGACTAMPPLPTRHLYHLFDGSTWLRGEHALLTTDSPTSAWPAALAIALSSVILLALLVFGCLFLFVVVVRFRRSRPKYILRRTVSVCSSVGGEPPIEVRGALLYEENGQQSVQIMFRSTGDQVRLPASRQRRPRDPL